MERLGNLLGSDRLSRLRERLSRFETLGEGPALAQEIRACIVSLVDYDLPGVLLAGLLSELNDLLSRRTIELILRRHRLPPGAWCWLALGSEGRGEQTLVTDQDNGLVFSASDEAEAEVLRPLFLEFAHDVNDALAECGFARCPGGIMASNPQWCLSADEWLERFRSWVRLPEPTALLNAAIFFDLRALHGERALVDQLQSQLLVMTAAAPAFLRLMANNALAAEVPQNFLGDIQVGDEPERIDLKKFGSRIFVDAARIFSLAQGVAAVNTAGRLGRCGGPAGLGEDELAASNAALSHVLRLRLRLQSGVAGRWHALDRDILRSALLQARRLQQRLKLNYAL